MDKTKNVTIKLSGQIDRVKITREKIENLFPLFVESKIMQNDDGTLHVHCWLTVALLEDNSPGTSQ
jgi:hypothetical protein